MNEHHYQRIDKGIERSQKSIQASERPRNEKGVFLPITTAERRSEIIVEALGALQQGETTDAIAERHGIAGRTLRSWLIAYPEADQARAILVANELSKSLQQIEDADGPMPLARARESFRGWAWIGERRLPQYFGPKQEITHVTSDLGDRLRRARERVIGGSSVDNQGNQEHTGVMSNVPALPNLQAIPSFQDLKELPTPEGPNQTKDRPPRT